VLKSAKKLKTTASDSRTLGLCLGWWWAQRVSSLFYRRPSPSWLLLTLAATISGWTLASFSPECLWY